MPLTKLQIAPGIDKQNTEYGAEGKWVDSDNVRFRYGLPEKIGGWAKVSSDALLGATRAVLTWSDLKGSNYAMYGTNKKLYAYSEGSYGDITPSRGTGSITQFETTNASTTVIVTTLHTAPWLVTMSPSQASVGISAESRKPIYRTNLKYKQFLVQVHIQSFHPQRRHRPRRARRRRRPII